jgi:hypothetical protein
MKKIVLTCTLVLAVVSFMALTPAITAAQTVKLTYSNFFPPTHIQSKLAESWCKEVGMRTDGRVEVQYFAGQTLTKAKQTYDAVIDGIADVGFSLFAYTRGKFPVIGTVDLPLGYPSGSAATAVINATYKKFMPKELNDVQVMYLHAHGPGMIHTKGKAVRTMEDLKGLKLRGTGYSAQAIKGPRRHSGSHAHARILPESAEGCCRWRRFSSRNQQRLETWRSCRLCHLFLCHCLHHRILRRHEQRQVEFHQRPGPEDHHGDQRRMGSQTRRSLGYQ